MVKTWIIYECMGNSTRHKVRNTAIFIMVVSCIVFSCLRVDTSWASIAGLTTIMKIDVRLWTILTGPASRNAEGLNYRWHSCVFTPFWDQFQSSCSYIKTFCCSPGPLIHLEKYAAEDCFKIVCSCKMRAVADYITLASFDSTWLLTLLQRIGFGMFYYNICPCRVTVYVWLTEV